jgi:hypothetical protein
LESFELSIGAYLHQTEGWESLPAALAGHTFVALREPGGALKTWGFSPAKFGSYDLDLDLHLLEAGVPGVVHPDDGAFDKPGVKIRSYAVTRAQAEAAMATVAEYASGRYPFSLRSRQCSTFALDVLRAAEIADLEGAAVREPREIYRQM